MFIFRKQLRLRTESSKSVTGNLEQLLEDRVALLGLLVVIHPLAGLAILDEQPGAGVVGFVSKDLAVALLGLAEPHLVLVENAQVDPGGQGNRRALGAPLVEIDGRVVVAEEVVDVRQLEQGAVVVPIEAEGLFEFDRGLAKFALGGQDGTLLEMVLGGRARSASAEPPRIFLASSGWPVRRRAPAR